VSGPPPRIASLALEPYALPFARPFETTGGRLVERRGFLLRVRDGQGRQGTGEAAPLPDFGGEGLAACEARLRHWCQTLRDLALPDPAPPDAALPDPAPPDIAAPDLLAAVLGPACAEALAASPVACHALEGALLDLAAQRAGLPLARLLHPHAAGSVPVNATLGGDAPAAAAAAARAAVAAGFGTLKLKVGVGGAAADEARLRAVRAAVGPGPRLRIDANGAWGREQAAALLARWAPLGLEYAEQPLPAADVEGMAWLAARSPVPIAADEALRTAADAERLLAARAASVLVLKPMLLGGAAVTLAIARRALAAGAAVVVTTVLEGIYGRLAALHLAAAIAALHRAAGRPLPACGLATGPLLARDHLPAPPAPARGEWTLPAAPGLGVG
jgi:o-succinylbenzoate synthase